LFWGLLPGFVQAQTCEGNCQDGYGVMHFPSGNRYEGYWQGGQKTEGSTFFANGDRYEGHYLANRRHGAGTYFYQSGNRFEGQWADGRKVSGTFLYVNGLRYEGAFQENRRHGQGRMVLPDGQVLEGRWAEGAFLGDGPAEIQGTTYAVVVGIADYRDTGPGNGDLRFADQDAEAFAAFLRSPQGGDIPPGQISLLTNQAATAAAIAAALNRQFRRAHPRDRVVFFFSGHGYPGGFVPYDADAHTLLSHQQLRTAFQASQALDKLCIADACHAGSIRYGGGNAPEPQNVLGQEDLEIAVFMSSRAEELSLELPELAHGLFAYFLLAGLRGEADQAGNRDGHITLEEMFRYTRGHVVDYADKHAQGHSQHPIMFGQFSRQQVVVRLR